MQLTHGPLVEVALLLTGRTKISLTKTNDDLFHRLETVRFFRLFTGEADLEYTGCDNTEPRGLKGVKARVLP